MLLFKLRKTLIRHFSKFRWFHILLALLIYLGSSWVMLKAAGEQALLPLGDFVYWILVTASTVGYGDYSPSTQAGKMIVAFFVIPMGLGLFGLVIGRIANAVGHFWRRGLKGMEALSIKDHILVIGWNKSRTLHLIKLLQKDQEDKLSPKRIVLCVQESIENPMPGEIDFVHVEDFANIEDMDRACLAQASCIIIDSESDEITMSAALVCADQNPQAHTIAYFHKEALSNILLNHCPKIECLPSVSIEMMAKSATDPGSSLLHHQLLDADKGMTQYSLVYKGEDRQIKDLFFAFKEQFHATLIGIAACKGSLKINPDLNETVETGHTLYYIAEQRVKIQNWETLS